MSAGDNTKGDEHGALGKRPDRRLLARLRLVVFLNITAFAIEFAVALIIGSVALFADSVDFVEDSAMSVLVLAALRLSPQARAKIGMGFAALLLLPAGAMIVALVEKLTAAMPLAPAPEAMGATGFIALAVNAACAFILASVRNHGGSLTRAAFLSARNDVVANLAIIAAAGVTARWPSVWPDIVVGVGIAVLNAGAAREVWTAAQRERRGAAPSS